MASTANRRKARVFMTGRSQAVRLPLEFRFSSDEVFIRRDPQSGDVILSQSAKTWNEVFAALDGARMPDDFLADRGDQPPGPSRL